MQEPDTKPDRKARSGRDHALGLGADPKDHIVFTATAIAASTCVCNRTCSPAPAIQEGIVEQLPQCAFATCFRVRDLVAIMAERGAEHHPALGAALPSGVRASRGVDETTRPGTEDAFESCSRLSLEVEDDLGFFFVVGKDRMKDRGDLGFGIYLVKRDRQAKRWNGDRTALIVGCDQTAMTARI